MSGKAAAPIPRGGAQAFAQMLAHNDLWRFTGMGFLSAAPIILMLNVKRARGAQSGEAGASGMKRARPARKREDYFFG